MARAFFLLLFVLFGLMSTSARADDAISCRSVTSDDAVAACSRLIESGRYRDKDLAVFYSNRGTALSSKRDNDKAIEDLNEAIRLDPQLAIAFNNRGLAWQNKKKYDQAIKDFDVAIALDPKLHTAYKNRAVAWLSKKNFDRSIADFNSAIELNPEPTADDYLGRALARIQRKQYDGAISDLDEAIRMQPQPKAVYFLNRSWAYILKANIDRALPDLNEAIRLDPTNAVAFNNRGFVYNGKGQYDRAMADLNQAVRLDPNSASGYKNRGITFEKKGDIDKALKDFRKAVSIDPHNQEAAAGVLRVQSRSTAEAPPAVAGAPSTTPAENNKAADVDKKTDTPGTQAEVEKADLIKFMSAAVAARHGGVMPKTMSEADVEVSAKAAITWKAKQTAEKTKRELEAMKVKPAHSDGYADIYIAKEAITSALRDPGSAIFGDNVFYANDRKMNGYYVPVVCGSVNSKNGFGGMSGQKKFVFFPTLSGRLALEGSVSNTLLVDYWNKMCAGKHD